MGVDDIIARAVRAQAAQTRIEVTSAITEAARAASAETKEALLPLLQAVEGRVAAVEKAKAEELEFRVRFQAQLAAHDERIAQVERAVSAQSSQASSASYANGTAFRQAEAHVLRILLADTAKIEEVRASVVELAEKIDIKGRFMVLKGPQRGSKFKLWHRTARRAIRDGSRCCQRTACLAAR